MRRAILIASALVLFGCKSDGKSDDDGNQAPSTATALEKPDTLARPPSGGKVPNELKPPR